MHRMIIFDDGLGRLGPMTDLRASFEVRTGMFTTAGRIAATWPKSLAAYWVPARLEPLLRARADALVNELPAEEIVCCVNGRWAMPDPTNNIEDGEALIEQATGNVVFARLRRADAEYLLTTGQLHERIHTRTISQRVLYRYPWDVIALLKQTIPRDILSTRVLEAAVPASDVSIMGEYPVEIARTARVCPQVVIDATSGPVIIHEHAVIRPGAVLTGPCSVGERATVLDRAVIRANTVIGPWCKAAGEISSTIFQGFANKAHDGFLGDSWVGKWVNFGAGTTNSNLLNTYGEVLMRVEPDGPRHRTGLTFLGAIVGDHVKTAICTRLMTGTLIGTGAMIATTLSPPTAVRRFAWLTDDGERGYRLEKFLEVMATVMDRRDRTPTVPYVQLVRDLHEKHVGSRAAAATATARSAE